MDKTFTDLFSAYRFNNNESVSKEDESSIYAYLDHYNADSGSRTHTGIRPSDFKSDSSTNSNISA